MSNWFVVFGCIILAPTAVDSGNGLRFEYRFGSLAPEHCK